MSGKSDRLLLLHMRDAIERLEAHLAGVTYEAFSSDWLRQDAVLRQLEVIGEIGRSLSETFRAHHADVPWSLMVGMRNKIAHDYFDIDLPLAWDTAINDVPELKKWLDRVLEEQMGRDSSLRSE